MNDRRKKEDEWHERSGLERRVRMELRDAVMALRADSISGEFFIDGVRWTIRWIEEQAKKSLGTPGRVQVAQSWKCEKCGAEGRVLYARHEDAYSVLRKVEEHHHEISPKCSFDSYKVRVVAPAVDKQ